MTYFNILLFWDVYYHVHTTYTRKGTLQYKTSWSSLVVICQLHGYVILLHVHSSYVWTYHSTTLCKYTYISNMSYTYSTITVYNFFMLFLRNGAILFPVVYSSIYKRLITHSVPRLRVRKCYTKTICNIVPFLDILHVQYISRDHTWKILINSILFHAYIKKFVHPP